MRKFMFLPILAILLVLSASIVAAQDTAGLRVGNFSPDSSAVDVYVNGELVVEGLEFPEVTAFFELEVGDYEVSITAAGAADTLFDPISVTLEASSNTTVAAVGSVENETVAATVFTEDNGAVASGQARVTLVHSVEGEGALDLYGSGILLIQAVRYPDLAAGRDGAFTRDLPIGRYNFDLSISEDSSVIIREVNGLELADGGSYLLVALGPQSLEGELLVVTAEGYQNPEEDGAETETTTETVEEVATEEAASEETTTEETASEETTTTVVAEGDAQLRIGNFSPDSSAVDVYVNGELLVEGLEFPEVTAFFGFEAGDYEVSITAAGAADTLFDPISVTLEDANNTTVAAVGSVENETVAATVFTEDNGAVASGQARVTLLHSVEGEGALDLYGSGILLIQAVRYPDLAAGRDGAFTRDLPIGRYNFDLSISEDSSVIIREVNGLELADGGSYLIVALGPQSLEGELLVVTAEGYQNPEEE